MGVLPLEFTGGASAQSLGLTGRESFDITGIADGLEPGCELEVVATAEDGAETRFQAKVRLDSEVDVDYYRNGGILHTVLRKMARGEM
jgi:aconitate hydratase